MLWAQEWIRGRLAAQSQGWEWVSPCYSQTSTRIQSPKSSHLMSDKTTASPRITTEPTPPGTILETDPLDLESKCSKVLDKQGETRKPNAHMYVHEHTPYSHTVFSKL